MASDPILPPPSARSLLLTVVGEMVTDRPEGAWTTGLLRIFGGLGIEEHAARQLLARSATAGWLQRERVGRAVRWGLAPRGQELVRDGVERSNAYLGGTPDWDGRWLILFITVPKEVRNTRKRLYGALTWLGMGNPTPGLWITPHADRAVELERILKGLTLDDTAVAVVGPTCGGLSDDALVARAWDLADLEHRYKRFLQEEEAEPDPLDRDARLYTFLNLINLQQRFMRRDPMLPTALLPDWVGREVAAHFRERRAALSSSAHERFWEIIDGSD